MHFLTVLGAGSLRSGSQHGQVMVKTLLSLQMVIFWLGLQWIPCMRLIYHFCLLDFLRRSLITSGITHFHTLHLLPLKSPSSKTRSCRCNIWIWEVQKHEICSIPNTIKLPETGDGTMAQHANPPPCCAGILYGQQFVSWLLSLPIQLSANSPGKKWRMTQGL